MRTILRYNFMRLAKIKKNLILYACLTVCAFFLALYMSEHTHTQRIAYVSQDLELQETISGIEFEKVSELPPFYDLLTHRYDAYLTYAEDGKMSITSLQNEAYEEMLLQAIATHQMPDTETHETQGKLETLMGFMMMFLLMQAFTNMMMYGEDKEKGCLQRVMSTPLSLSAYLAGQFLFSLFVSFVPCFTLLSVLTMFNVEIGASLLVYAGFLLVLCSLGSAFALFLFTICNKEEDANLSGSAILVLTSMMAGGFVSFHSSNDALQSFLQILPQKSFLSFLHGFENASLTGIHYLQFAYVILLTLCFFFFSCYKIWKQRSI